MVDLEINRSFELIKNCNGRLYKTGNKSDPENYRPNSVLPIASKSFERVLYNRLETYLESVNFLYDEQYGFWPKSNILSAITDIVTRLKIGIDRKQIGLGIFIYKKRHST